MFRTLYSKLALALLGMFVFLVIAFVLISNYSMPVFMQELNQRLHRDLADNLVKETQLFKGSEVNEKDWNKVFMGLMLVNPSIEVYLLDTQGKILAHAAPPDREIQYGINLAPVNAYLEREKLPITGDDPRSAERQKVFSAAPINDGGKLAGYLYIVLGGEAYDSVFNMLESSYVSRYVVISLIVALLIALGVGLVLFNVITRRSRTLAEAMNEFKYSNFEKLPKLPDRFDGRPGDEIDQLGQSFREMASRIIQQMKDLQHVDASRRELVASVSHDLRTPLTSLQGYLETLTQKGDSLTADERKKLVEIAFKHSQRLGKLVTELFELALLDTQGTRLHFEPFSLSELVQDVAQKFKLKAEQKHLLIDTNIPEDAPFASADIALIERVLENLIDNAIKYTPEGGKIQMLLNARENMITFNVTDSGPGIPKEDIPHVFDRFYRVSKHRDSTIEGTGLGLAIAQRILQLHNSCISVDSQLNQGTTFRFDLPAFH